MQFVPMSLLWRLRFLYDQRFRGVLGLRLLVRRMLNRLRGIDDSRRFGMTAGRGYTAASGPGGRVPWHHS